MGEFDYIAWLRLRTPTLPHVLVGPGDDCAVLEAPSPPAPLPEGVGKTKARSWLVTTDMLLEGSHFVLAEAGPRRVGRKAMSVNLSDIAAMGGKPIAAFVSLGLPRGNAGPVAEDLYLGMREVADAFDTAIAGGDTNTWDGGLVISVTVMGEAGPQGPILRRVRQAGDWLFVTGPLGGSILGKHLDFVPRIREAAALQTHAAVHAMIDISDGLSADIFHICEESNCGAVLYAEKIPISHAARMLTGNKSPLEHALSDGEDFELAFAVDPADGERLLKTQPIPGINLAHVGDVVNEKALFLEENGKRRRIEPQGFVHSFQ